MNPNLIALEEISIAKPCRADWQNMTGDERARFCGSCHKSVYDISQLTREQAHQLIAEKEGDLCLRLHRRADGTVITSDCPVGIAATPRPLWFGVAALVALIGSGLAGCAAPVEVMGDIAQVPTLDTRKIEKQRVAPIEVEAPPLDLGKVESVPVPNHPASVESHSSVTLGAPMMPKPTPQSAPTPQPTNAPLMGKPTMGETTIGETTISPVGAEMTMGDVAPIYQKAPHR